MLDKNVPSLKYEEGKSVFHLGKLTTTLDHLLKVLARSKMYHDTSNNGEIRIFAGFQYILFVLVNTEVPRPRSVFLSPPTAPEY